MFQGICPRRSRCRDISYYTNDQSRHSGNLQIDVVFKELIVTFQILCGRIPVSMMFRQSSTKVVQTINVLYCCPDQETGEVLTSDDWMWRCHLRFSLLIPRVSVRDFPARVPDKWVHFQEFCGYCHLKFSILSSNLCWARSDQRQVLPAGGFRHMVLTQDTLHLVFGQGSVERWNLRSPGRTCRG